MAMFMVKPWYGKSGPATPDECFDPTTHIATEENFIKFLEFGVYDSKYVGYKVQLSNGSGYYNKGIWIIADVNHDSTNTGQSNCYDLISEDCFNRAAFGNNNNWRDSTPRSWLNNTFYSGFSTEFKAHVICPKYKSKSTWYTDDYVIIPSYKEINGGSSSYQDNEGIAYPIFTDNNSRKKYQAGTTTYREWWTRSRNFQMSIRVWYVSLSGGTESCDANYSLYFVPVLRVS